MKPRGYSYSNRMHHFVLGKHSVQEAFLLGLHLGQTSAANCDANKRSQI